MSVSPIVVLASGRGSNLQAILKAIDAGKLDAKVVAVISDQPLAPALEIARVAQIPALSIPFQGDRNAHEQAILKALLPFQPRFLVMAGYRRIVTSCLLNAFCSERGYFRVTNIHPSLLPAFPGLNAYAQAFQQGCKMTGVTVHLVESTVDSGPICAQKSFSIVSCRSVEEVEKKGLEIEHLLYPATLQWVLSERFGIEYREGRVCVCPS